ncbi:MAG: aminodeoxychorismate lyase [Xanthomonadales bacterium]|nr:aminodeoxychorismate lyase [Xanthomonadales bacterium]
MTLVNGVETDRVPVTDRGLLYGDGLFETMRFDAAGCALWPLHMERLRRGCRRLEIPAPDGKVLESETQACARGGECMIRLSVTRGSGSRGYAPPANSEPTRIVQRFPLPASDGKPLRLLVCETRLAGHPALGTIKHLNRLENVLAAAEVQRGGCGEGLMLDCSERIIEATSANFFVVRGETCLTPELEGTGVAGVFRAWLADRVDLVVMDLGLGDLDPGDGLFLANAVTGIRPVGEVVGLGKFDVAAVAAFSAEVGTPWSGA